MERWKLYLTKTQPDEGSAAHLDERLTVHLDEILTWRKLHFTRTKWEVDEKMIYRVWRKACNWRKACKWRKLRTQEYNWGIGKNPVYYNLRPCNWRSFRHLDTNRLASTKKHFVWDICFNYFWPKHMNKDLSESKCDSTWWLACSIEFDEEQSSAIKADLTRWFDEEIMRWSWSSLMNLWMRTWSLIQWFWQKNHLETSSTPTFLKKWTEKKKHRDECSRPNLDRNIPSITDFRAVWTWTDSLRWMQLWL